jgi:uncharacterized protein YuzE
VLSVTSGDQREDLLVTGDGQRNDDSSRRGYCVPHQQDHEILEETMKVKYDEEVDVLTIELSDAPVEESDEDKPGVILDYDKNGNIVGIEILNASKRVQNPKSVEYAVA